MSNTENQEPQKPFTLTPEIALNFLDQVAAKFQGTRSDHHVLEASMAMLKGIVQEWQQMKEAAAKSMSAAPKGRPKN